MTFYRKRYQISNYHEKSNGSTLPRSNKRYKTKIWEEGRHKMSKLPYLQID